VGFFAPGLPQLLRGKVLEGLAALFLWVSLLALVGIRFDRILFSVVGGVDGWIALTTLVMGLTGVWWWSFWESRAVEAAGAGALAMADPPPGTGTGSVRPDAADGRRPGAPRSGWQAFRENRMAMLGLGVVVVLYLGMLLTPFLAPFEPEYRSAYQVGGDMTGILAAPSFVNIMGTDQYSQDVFSRILYGARISLTIGLVAVGISVTLGAFLGAVAGYWGGMLDKVIMRLVDMVMAIPRLVVLIAIVALFPTTIFVVIIALAFTQWPFTTRMVRGEVLALKEREFHEAAKALGFSKPRILFRHLLPNALGPLIVVATLGVGNAIILEAGLSFLGMGVQAGTPSWGSMVAGGKDLLMNAWWVATFPGLAIVLAVLAFNLVGDGIRDALDPRQEGRARP
jgi:peptide/nickel transport system permease protein